MRSNKLFFAAGLALLIFAGLLIGGCSNDGPTGRAVTINSEYETVEGEVNLMVDSTLALVSLGLQTFAELHVRTDTEIVIRQELQSEFDSDSVNYDDYWYISFLADLQTSFGQLYVDSIMFLESGSPMVNASTADAMIFKRNWQLAYADFSESYAEYDVRSNLVMSGLNTFQANISGTTTLEGQSQVIGDDETVVRDFVITATYTNLIVDENNGTWAAGCPVSGSIDCDVTWTRSDDSGGVANTEWEINMSFENGVATAEISDGRVEGTYVRTFCTLQ